MESVYLILAVVIAMGLALYLLMERRWMKIREEVKSDLCSQPMWALMQQQMDQLRGQVGEGLHQNISLLNEQLRTINEQVNRQLQLVNQ